MSLLVLPTAAQIAQLLTLLPELETPGATMGAWAEDLGPNAMPMMRSSELELRLYPALYDCGFVSAEADQKRGRAVLEDRDLLRSATLPDICGALTFLARGERFCEGMIASAFKDGTIVAVFRRLKQLVEEQGSDQRSGPAQAAKDGAMRLVVWNCNMALHKKLDALASLRPDVAVICECANPEIVRLKSKGVLPESVVWVGESKNKGVAVISLGPWRVRLDEAYDPAIRHVAPVHVDGPMPFRLLAVWAFNRGDDYDETGRGPLARALSRYESFCKQSPLVVAGDFNNNVIWSNPNNPTRGHMVDVANLVGCGLFSAYHYQRDVTQGKEPEPTLYWRDRKVDGFRYPIDFIFAPEGWMQALRGVEVGKCEAWVGSGLSDHVPLIADFEFVVTELVRTSGTTMSEGEGE